MTLKSMWMICVVSLAGIALIFPSFLGAQTNTNEHEPGMKYNPKSDSVSVRFNNTQISEIARIISRKARIKVMVDEGIEGTITHTLQNVPLETAIKKIFKSYSTAFIYNREKVAGGRDIFRVESVKIMASGTPSSDFNTYQDGEMAHYNDPNPLEKPTSPKKLIHTGRASGEKVKPLIPPGGVPPQNHEELGLREMAPNERPDENVDEKLEETQEEETAETGEVADDQELVEENELVEEEEIEREQY
jgi:hypothetical protein